MADIFRKKLTKGFSKPGKGSFGNASQSVVVSDNHPDSTGVKKLTSKKRKPKLKFGK